MEFRLRAYSSSCFYRFVPVVYACCFAIISHKVVRIFYPLLHWTTLNVLWERKADRTFGWERRESVSGRSLILLPLGRIKKEWTKPREWHTITNDLRRHGRCVMFCLFCCLVFRVRLSILEFLLKLIKIKKRTRGRKNETFRMEIHQERNEKVC